MKIRLLMPVALLAMGAATMIVAACGGDGSPGGVTPAVSGSATARPVGIVPTPVVTPSTGGSADSRQPIVQGPSAKYAPSEEDLKGFYRASVPDTFSVNNEIFATIGPFLTPGEANESIKLWGFFEGWVVALQPEGLLSSVVKGAYYITSESFLFTTTEGAEKAYLTFEKFYKDTKGSEVQTTKALANQSSAFRLQKGKVGNTTIDAVYHSLIFRRGNLIAVVRTYGGAPFMTIDAAREVAVIMDARALGERATPLPTPGGAQPTTVGGARP